MNLLEKIVLILLALVATFYFSTKIYQFVQIEIGGYLNQKEAEKIKAQGYPLTDAEKKLKELYDNAKCETQTDLPLDKYTHVYTVVKGDSLLTIASSQLGDSSRINDILLLNNTTYPQLSVKEPFLEVGWKLILPIKELRPLQFVDYYASEKSNIIKIHRVVISQLKDNKISYLDERVSGSWKYHEDTLGIDQNTAFFGMNRNDMSIGQCVVLIEQFNAGLLGISKNY